METAFLKLLQQLSPLLAVLLLGGIWVVRYVTKENDSLKALIKTANGEIARLNEARIAERDRDREVLRDVAGILERVQTDIRDHDGRVTHALQENLKETRRHVTEQIAQLK